MKRGFIRFVGKLWETDEFEPGIGWETEHIARRPLADPDYQLQLVSESEGVMVEAGVELRVDKCVGMGADGPFVARVIGYLPLRPGGSSIVFRRGERVLYQVAFAASPPRVVITSLDIDDKKTVHLHWKAKHDRPLWFNVVFVDGRR